MKTGHVSPDVVVIGAGPTGCVTALAHARTGARVLLLEAHPEAAKRLAGEWLHPPGAEILKQLDIGPIPASLGYPTGCGFVFFPGDGTPPIVLDYADSSAGLACEHRTLVAALREAAASHPDVQYVPFAKVTGIDGQRLSYTKGERGGAASVSAERIVGADGRSSIVRRCLRLPPDRTHVSCMAGVLLEDVELPYEGFGHVLLGGPGPMFIYRISPRHVRACLDVPSYNGSCAEGTASMLEAYGPTLPTQLLPAFRQALHDRPIAWAANYFRSRAHYGRDGLTLVGDAVGHFHPLSAVGLTLGFMDAQCLARSKSIEVYCQEQRTRTRVPELLAKALYEALTLEGEGGAAMRNAIYRMWRQDPSERLRTMRLLAVQETDVFEFCRPFLKAMALATECVIKDMAFTRRWHRPVQVLGTLGERFAWLASSVLPGAIRPWTGAGARALPRLAK